MRLCKYFGVVIVVGFAGFILASALLFTINQPRHLEGTSAKFTVNVLNAKQARRLNTFVRNDSTSVYGNGGGSSSSQNQSIVNTKPLEVNAKRIQDGQSSANAKDTENATTRQNNQSIHVRTTDQGEKVPIRITANKNKNLPGYPTRAVQDMFEFHNHLLLQSHMFFGKLNKTSPFTQAIPAAYSNTTKPLCIVVLASNRIVPYVDMLFYMLSHGHSMKQLYSQAEFHVVNSEQRKDKQGISYLNNIQKLGFVHLHGDLNLTDNAYRLSQLKAYRKAAEICKSSKSNWCLILEDDATVPSGFLSLFQQHIADPLKGKEELYAFVKLFRPFNNALSKANQVIDKKWNKGWYSNFIKQKRDHEVANVKFKILRNADQYGGTANAFPKESVEKLMEYYDTFSDLSQIPKMNDLILNDDFIKYLKRDRAQIDPSLITHIGLISEQDHRADFSRVFADVRFQSNQYK